MAQDWTVHLRLFCEVNSCADDLTKIEESKRATQQNVTYVHIFFFFLPHSFVLDLKNVGTSRECLAIVPFV